MHELSLMDNVLEMAVQHAREQDATRIHRITMRIGEMSGVSVDALSFAFDVLTQDTMAAGAEFEVQTLAAMCRCEGCGAEFGPDGPIAQCSACGGTRATLVQGREIELASMEVS
ncbi:MAG: hydrogenase maturation nickel metallochaperone HypA [Armatimonadetes bacterium]|nr:hydrogenase maturation nickel metallochaperone HypA [Armatimonadota bacterium]